MDSQPPAEQDRLARKMMVTCIAVGAQAPRAAYEMFRRQQVPDAEWEAYRGAWERNWEESLDLYETITSLEAELRSGYADYMAANKRAS